MPIGLPLALLPICQTDKKKISFPDNLVRFSTVYWQRFMSHPLGLTELQIL